MAGLHKNTRLINTTRWTYSKRTVPILVIQVTALVIYNHLVLMIAK